MCSDDTEQARYCAPIDFGDWHITIDGEETLCGRHSVEQHHISGTLDDYDNVRDCPECRQKYEQDLRGADTESESS